MSRVGWEEREESLVSQQSTGNKVGRLAELERSISSKMPPRLIWAWGTGPGAGPRFFRLQLGELSMTFYSEDDQDALYALAW
jgi:hypothetical protein